MEEKEREVDVLCATADDFGFMISFEQQAKSTPSQRLVVASIVGFHRGAQLPFPVSVGFLWGQSVKCSDPF